MWGCLRLAPGEQARPANTPTYSIFHAQSQINGKNYSMNELEKILPGGYRLRKAELSDLQAVTELYVAEQMDLRGESELIQEDFLSFWQRPGFSLETDAWVVEGPEAKGARPVVGYADIVYKSEFTHLRGDVCVHPLYRSLGIGTRLIRRLDARARQLASLATPQAWVTLRNIMEAGDQQGRSLHENEGFEPVRYFFRMQIELEAQPAEPKLPPGIELRPYQPGQERTLFETIEEAFQDHWGHAAGDFEVFLHTTIQRDDFDPGLILAAWDGEEMAGCAICQMRQNRGWIRQLAVRRPWRRQGLGMALLQKAFGEIFQRGHRQAALGVDAASETGATRLYERAGMGIVRRSVVYEKVIQKPQSQK